MDPAYLTGLAIFSGSVVGALTSLTSAWLTKQHEARHQRASEAKLWRQRLCAQFIDEASKLYVDALVRDQAEAPAMVGLYALLSKIRMTSNADIVESAEAVIGTILRTYSCPNKSTPELQDLVLSRTFVDPLLAFSEVCRDELGNRPSRRHAAKLRAFWEEITANPLLDFFAALDALTPKGHLPRALFNQLSAASALVAGAAGFFSLRQPPPWLHPDGALEATSFYETSLLKSTLERLVDFDRINAREMRFSAGAVNVRTGNFVYFDNETHTIPAEHVMASGSLPPGFPAVEIEGEFYWDGGLVSNTPLQWVVENGPRQDTLAFQVDLWSARGELSGNLAEVAMRQKEIQFSSRTRANTDQFKQQQRARNTLATLLSKLPPELGAGEEARFLSTLADHKVYSLESKISGRSAAPTIVASMLSSFVFKPSRSPLNKVRAVGSNSNSLA